MRFIFNLHCCLWVQLLLASLTLQADDLIQNGDFAKGDATGWGGEFKLEPVDMGATPTGQIDVQLDPNGWTTLTQDIAVKSPQLKVTLEYSVSGNTFFSQDTQLYKAEASKLGVSEERLRETTSDQNACGEILLAGDPSGNGNGLKLIPLANHARGRQSVHHSFSFPEAENHRTFTILLPPGKGTVTLYKVTADSTSSSAPMTRSAIPGANSAYLPGSPGLSREPASVSLLKNSDFSDGTTHWRGDCKPADAAMSTNLVTGNHENKGIVVELHSSTWTKITQDIEAKNVGRNALLLMQYTVSNDFNVSDNPKDFQNIGALIDFGSASIEGAPGKIIAFVDCPPTMRASGQGGGNITVYNDNVSQTAFQPAAEEKIQRAVASLSVTQNGQDKPVFCVAIPPGKGSITFTNISLLAQ